MPRVLSAVILLLLAAQPLAPATKAATLLCPNGANQLVGIDGGAEIAPLCSVNFEFAETCNGTDQVSPLRHPWLTVPIDIVGVTLVLRVDGGTALVRGYAMAGNNYDPDVMGWALANNPHTTWYPKGYGFRFNPAGPDAQHIDAHVWCTPVGASFELFETVYYLAPPAPANLATQGGVDAEQ